MYFGHLVLGEICNLVALLAQFIDDYVGVFSGAAQRFALALKAHIDVRAGRVDVGRVAVGKFRHVVYKLRSKADGMNPTSGITTDISASRKSARSLTKRKRSKSMLAPEAIATHVYL